jgi:hypothetical protein
MARESMRRIKSNLAQSSRAALEVDARYYLLTLVVRPSRVRVRRPQQEALKALALEGVGSQAVLRRKADLIKVLQHVLPLVVVTPLESRLAHGSVAVLERPRLHGAAMEADPDGPLRDLYSLLEMKERDETTAGGGTVRDVVRDTGRKLAPDLDDSTLDALTNEIASEMVGDRPTVRANLRRESEALGVKLDSRGSSGDPHALS